MRKMKRFKLLQDDSDFEQEEQEMKVCYVGQLKHKFIMKIDPELDAVIEIKSQILERLGLSTPDDGLGSGWNSTNPWMKKIKLFSLKGGLEFNNKDRMESFQGQQYLYYSFGEPFDHSVRMEFIDIVRKLGEGGFGAVYLGYDKLLKQEVAVKVMNFGSSVKNSNMITKEIDALGQLRHKNIVKLLDYFPLPKKQQLIVVMEYLKGGELDDLWKSQPMRRFSEQNAFALFIQLIQAIDYCHNSKIIHRDMKFQNVMLADEPKYDEHGKLIISSIILKVVDFGIFGSIQGIRMEQVNCGSLRFMAPELLQGQIQSTTKIDIWSLGLMLHAMVFGFLPFNANEREGLEKQILNDDVDYTSIKKLKTTSIKNEVKRALNIMLKNTSDDLIDLIDQMLKKDPEQRIGNLGILNHPWIKKNRFPDDYGSESDEQKEVKEEDKNSLDSNSDFFAEQNMQETNFDSDPVQLDNKSSRGTSSPHSFMNSELERGRAGGKGEGGRVNQILQNHYMFNIEEHDNETTGNFVKVDLKQRKPNPRQQIDLNKDGPVYEEEIFTSNKKVNKRNSKMGICHQVSLKKSNLVQYEERRQSVQNNVQQTNTSDTERERNQSSQQRKDEQGVSSSPFGLSQNQSQQDGFNITSMRSKNAKKKRGKTVKKANHAIDGEFEGDINNYQMKMNKTNRKQQKQNSNYITNDSCREKKNSTTQADFHKHSYIIEGPREGAAAQSIRLNSLAAMEKNNRAQADKLKQLQHQKFMQSQLENKLTIDKLKHPQQLGQDNQSNIVLQNSNQKQLDDLTKMERKMTHSFYNPNMPQNNNQGLKKQNTAAQQSNYMVAPQKQIKQEVEEIDSAQVISKHSGGVANVSIFKNNDYLQVTSGKKSFLNKIKNVSQNMSIEQQQHQNQLGTNTLRQSTENSVQQLAKMSKMSNNFGGKKNSGNLVSGYNQNNRLSIGDHLLQVDQTYLPPATSKMNNLELRLPSRGSSPHHMNELLIASDSPLRIKKKDLEIADTNNSAIRAQQILQSFDKINVKNFHNQTSSQLNSGYQTCPKVKQLGVTTYFSQTAMKNQPRRDIPFYRQNNQQQIITQGGDALSQVNEQDRAQELEIMRATSAGASNEKFTQLQKAPNLTNNKQIKSPPEIQQVQAQTSLCSNRSNDALTEQLRVNDRKNSHVHGSSMSIPMSSKQENVQPSFQFMNGRKTKTTSEDNALKTGSVFSASKGSVATRNNTNVPKPTINAKTSNKNFRHQLNLERSKTHDAKQVQQAIDPRQRFIIKASNITQYQQREKESPHYIQQQTMFITPIKKAMVSRAVTGVENQKQASRNQQSHASRSSKRNSESVKYSTIDNQQKSGGQANYGNISVKPLGANGSAFKNNTQSNFNVVPSSIVNYNNQGQERSKNYNQGGTPQTSVLTNHHNTNGSNPNPINNERSSRGTSHGGKRTEKKKTFQIKGQAIQPTNISPVGFQLGFSLIPAQTRFAQSDLKRSRNQNDGAEQLESRVTQQQQDMKPAGGNKTPLEDGMDDVLRFPRIPSTPTPEKND